MIKDIRNMKSAEIKSLVGEEVPFFDGTIIIPDTFKELMDMSIWDTIIIDGVCFEYTISTVDEEIGVYSDRYGDMGVRANNMDELEEAIREEVDFY